MKLSAPVHAALTGLCGAFAPERRSVTGFPRSLPSSPVTERRSAPSLMRVAGGMFGLAAWLFCLAAPAAQPALNLPYDGLAQGHDVTVPITLQATNNLAGLQADILFNGSRLVCTGAVALVSGPADVVVDGAQIQPGKFRLLAYSPTGTALTNDVVCNVTFSAYPNAANGPAALGSGTVYFGSDTASTLAGGVIPGLLLVGDAFAFFPGGGRAQFRGTTGSNYVLRASTNLTTWTPILTNPALAGLVWTLDSDALVFPKRFYRISPAQ